MQSMHPNYGRDLDLNLLRVFQVVADTGSVTQAAALLYLTQPAVSAALKRLSVALGAPAFVQRGRKLVLSERGQQLLMSVRLHLQPLIDGALSPPAFDPKQSQRTLRLGVSDAAELWLVPRLLARLETEAPHMRLVCVPVQFRNVGQALGSGSVELAISVADELPAGILRQTLFLGDFVCLFDPRRVALKARPSEAEYFARDHVVVSYNADLRGVVEDVLGKSRRVRCSVSSFANLGAILDGASLVATVPRIIAEHTCAQYPRLATAELPFVVAGTPMELLWSTAVDDDAALRFVRQHIVAIAIERTGPLRKRARRR
jgi:LysR family transcriptional activator of mexEF-oprN operon